MMKANGDVLIEADRLSKFFDIGRGQRVHAVENVSLSVAAREIVGLVGESGSGKSTFGKTLLGLYRKPPARCDIAAKPCLTATAGGLSASAMKMQMIFQDPYSSLNPRMTVGEIIGEGLRLHTNLPRRKSTSAYLPGWTGGTDRRSRLALSARVFRRPAPAHRHCPGIDTGTGVRGLRRARFRA